MDPVIVGIVSLAVGLVGGFATTGITALASFRTSQAMARAPLGQKIHELVRALVGFLTARGTEDEAARRLDFEIAWNVLRIQQQILCPSHRLELMLYLVRRLAAETTLDLKTASDLGGQLLDKVTRMVAAHSSKLFRRSALKLERKIIREWMGSEESKLLDPEMREALSAIAARRPRVPGGEAVDNP